MTARSSKLGLRLAFLELSFKETQHPQSLESASSPNGSVVPERKSEHEVEADCEYLKWCCETLTEENRRLQELRALKNSMPYMQLPATTLTTCPSCERVTTAATSTAASAAATVPPLVKPQRRAYPFPREADQIHKPLGQASSFKARSNLEARGRYGQIWWVVNQGPTNAAGRFRRQWTATDERRRSFWPGDHEVKDDG